MWKLNVNDFVKGAVTAVLAAAIFAIVGFFQQPGFDIFTADWGAIGGTALNAAVAAMVGYLAKNLITDKQGEVVTPVGNIGHA